MKSTGRFFIKYSAAVLGFLFALLQPNGTMAQAQNYPNKPITIISPIPAGGSTDKLVRQVAVLLQKRLGQPVIVENKPGGASSIGTAFVAKATPDGYTLVLVNASHVINPHVYASLPYDALRDFAPVVQMVNVQMGLFVNPNLPAKNIAEFLALARTKPETINYGTAGNGGVGHLTGEMFKQSTGLTIQHIPYRGSAPALIDALSGQVQAVIVDAPGGQQYVKSGQLRALAITSKTRSSSLPDIPTFNEAGVKNMETSIWVGLLAPAKTPLEIIRLLNREIVAILRDPAMAADVTSQGFELVAGTPDEFGKAIRDDYAVFGAIVKSAKIRSD